MCTYEGDGEVCYWLDIDGMKALLMKLEFIKAIVSGESVQTEE